MSNCKCNYHLGMGPNLLCPEHGKREDLGRRIDKLEELRDAVLAYHRYKCGAGHGWCPSFDYCGQPGCDAIELNQKLQEQINEQS